MLPLSQAVYLLWADHHLLFVANSYEVAKGLMERHVEYLLKEWKGSISSISDIHTNVVFEIDAKKEHRTVRIEKRTIVTEVN